MKRVYHSYDVWEDHAHGMFDDSADQTLLEHAVSLLSNQEMLYRCMCRAVFEWPLSAEMNLTNRSRNRQAWLGQAACCVTYGVPENLTKQAWRGLSEESRVLANACADMVIADFELRKLREKKH